ncbi:hypothetical protein BS78_07G105700 [Paspalum vaginatum]|nr:hypothetical protein BS78_07G105700 [Paspalum vaginatum]
MTWRGLSQNSDFSTRLLTTPLISDHEQLQETLYPEMMKRVMHPSCIWKMLRVFDENSELKKQAQEAATLRTLLAAAELKAKEKSELAKRVTR